MVSRVLVPLTAAAGLLLAGAFWVCSRSPVSRSPSAIVPAEKSVPKRFVSPHQLASAGTAANRTVAPFWAVAHDGQRIHWNDLLDGRPLVLVFIKRGCPCSVEFAPFFQQAERAYRGQVRFLGVLDGSVDDARRHAEANRVSYPVLADPDQEIIVRFGARNGGYTALVNSRGVIEHLWPGCSAEMMTELGQWIAAQAAVPERPLDCSAMPQALTTGCPFVP